MNEDIINKISPGPYEWAIIKEGEKQIEHVLDYFAKGSGDAHAIWLSGDPLSVTGADSLAPEHAVLLCMTGNGPKSKDNAHAIMAILNQRQWIIDHKQSTCLPIPTTPEAVAWSEYAIMLENALGIADPIPEKLKNQTAEDIINYRRAGGGGG